MLIFIQLSPILLTFTLLLLFRRPPIQAAIAGASLVILLWLAQFGAPVSPILAMDVILDTGVLFLSTAAVIAPGLAFVILIERSGANKEMADWVRNLGWSKAEQVIFIVLGLAPLLEAMTGFGVSLIATVPLLLALFSRKVSLRIALSGMVIMPWGTLGLATVIGAALASMPATTLGQASALVSAPVFLALTTIALWIAGVREMRAWLLMLVSWVQFIAVLYIVSGIAGPEIAGVTAGLSVLCLGLLSARRKKSISAWPKVAWPYVALLATIIMIKLVLFTTGVSSAVKITGKAVSWQPLASPGLALILVLLMFFWVNRGSELTKDLGVDWARRSRKPLTTIFFFLLMSQALLKCGFLAGFQSSLAQLSSLSLAPVAAILAGLSGYMTGSNVGGNAIFMPSLAHLPVPNTNWLAAIQNSGAGHGALGSLSILALITGLAKAERDEEQRLIRFGFALVCLNITLVAAMGTFLIIAFGQ
jgi:lactate permease